MHVHKGLILAQNASRSQEVLSLITVGVSYAVGQEFTKTFFVAFARVGYYTFDLADIFSFDT